MKKTNRFAPYRNRIIFTSLFTVLAILLMVVGFWETILLSVITGIGYLIGMMQDEKRSISSILASMQAFFER